MLGDDRSFGLGVSGAPLRVPFKGILKDPFKGSRRALQLGYRGLGFRVWGLRV